MRIFNALVAISILGAWSNHASAVSEQDRQRIASMPIMTVISNALHLSWDLRGYNKYHCYYDVEQGSKRCDHMDTVSGQYEDFYMSVMTKCSASRICEGANFSMASWNYMMSDQRLCTEIGTQSCTKLSMTETQMRQELMDLVDFRDSIKKSQSSPRPRGR